MQCNFSIIRLSLDLSEYKRLLGQAWALLSPPIWPNDEIRPLHEFMDRFCRPEAYQCDEIVHVAVKRATVVGMIVAHFLPDTRSGFGEYLAVTREAEFGTGSILYRANRDYLSSLGAERILLEYDSPIGLNREGMARWRWYQKLGVYRIIWSYWQPPYRCGDEIKSMALAYDTRIGLRRSTPREIALSISEIYEKVYLVNRQSALYKDVCEQIKDEISDWLVDISGKPFSLE